MFDFQVQKQFNLSQGPLQANMDIYTDVEVIKNNPNIPMINKVADTAVSAIPSPQYSQISTILQEELHLALTGVKSAKEALDKACEQIDNLK
jgi:ABC-type glycerol-3-phosphate transport system substrate-binding protein